jgi:hypothetical protein
MASVPEAGAHIIPYTGGAMPCPLSPHSPCPSPRWGEGTPESPSPKRGWRPETPLPVERGVP